MYYGQIKSYLISEKSFLISSISVQTSLPDYSQLYIRCLVEKHLLIFRFVC